MRTAIRIVILAISLTIFAATIAAQDPGDSKIVYSATVNKPGSTPIDELLTAIKGDEALPIILYDTGEGGIMQGTFPVDLPQVEIKNGRILSSDETRFLSIPQREAVYFCPNSHEDQKCLVHEEFQQPQPLQCAREPTPTIIEFPDHLPCGQGGVGTAFYFTYPICKDEEPFQNTIFRTYSFCYNKSSKRILFAALQIVSARLLSEPLLSREQEIKPDEPSTETYDGLIDLEYRNWVLVKGWGRSEYRPQTLASPQYMAFYAWKKTTNHFMNIDLQHVKLFDLWNEINDHIATNSKFMFAAERMVITRVVDIPRSKVPILDDMNQIFEFWITVVVERKTRPFRALAILMNNYVGTQLPSTKKPHYIETLCEENLCDESLKQKFAQVQGEVRCCAMNTDIQLLFGIDELKLVEKVLYIPNVHTAPAWETGIFI